MRVLLDTHALLWFLSGDSRLSRHAFDLITDPGNDVLLSTGSLWEIVIKVSLGKLPLPGPFEEVIPAQLEAERIEMLPIEVPHLAALQRLPPYHRDPFDRLIIAQATAEGIPVVTDDPAFRRYDLVVLWDELPERPEA
jgi:PIN domain nuclease of toxin-antitoxin system